MGFFRFLLDNPTTFWYIRVDLSCARLAFGITNFVLVYLNLSGEFGFCSPQTADSDDCIALGFVRDCQIVLRELRGFLLYQRVR